MPAMNEDRYFRADLIVSLCNVGLIVCACVMVAIVITL
jgi:hypothetical protein